MRKKNLARPAFVIICLFVIFVWGAVAYAATMIGVPATVDAIDLKAKSMKVTYADPDSKETKHAVVQWDNSTEFINEGSPPDLKESSAKPGDIRKGAKVYVTIEEKAEDGKHRLERAKAKLGL